MTIATALLLTLTACDQEQPTIDGASEESMRASLENISSELSSDSERKEFQESVAIILTSTAFSEGLLNIDADKASADVRDTLDGMSAEEVKAYAAGILRERKEEEREQALRDIADLEEKKKSASEDSEALSDFSVEDAKFYLSESGFSSGDPIIDLTVRNGTDKAISRAYFHGVVASPDRSVPWISEDFNYSISGGIEPGETLNWKLSPNQFGPWGTSVPDDAILTVTVERLDGPSGEELWSSEGLSDRERDRLKKLKSQYQ